MIWRIKRDAIRDKRRRNEMGEILDIAAFIATPLGAVLAVAGLAALYFFGRWVLTD